MIKINGSCGLRFLSACIPTIVDSTSFNDFIEEKFNNYVVVAIALYRLWCDFYGRIISDEQKKNQSVHLEDMSFATALEIWYFRVLCIREHPFRFHDYWRYPVGT